MKEKKLDIEHENEMYHRKFYTEHRAEVIEHYIHAVSKRMFNPSAESESDYIASMSEILLYLDESDCKLIFAINGGIDTNDDSLVISSLTALSESLCKNDFRK